jgi:hypothetical protein
VKKRLKITQLGISVILSLLFCLNFLNFLKVSLKVAPKVSMKQFTLARSGCEAACLNFGKGS